MTEHAGRHRGYQVRGRDSLHHFARSGRWSPTAVKGIALGLAGMGLGAALLTPSVENKDAAYSSLVNAEPGAGEAEGDGAKAVAPSGPITAPKAVASAPAGVLNYKAVSELAPKSAAAAKKRTTPIRGSGVSGLTPSARQVLDGVTSTFGQINSVSGVRADYLPDHPSGRAIDFMIPNWSSSSGLAVGNGAVELVQKNAGKWNVKYIIFRQRIWYPGRGWKSMSNRGSATANHMDHVHVSVN